MPRLSDANDDLNESMRVLRRGSSYDAAEAIVRLLGSIAVTLAMMYDRMEPTLPASEPW